MAWPRSLPGATRSPCGTASTNSVCSSGRSNRCAAPSRPAPGRPSVRRRSRAGRRPRSPPSWACRSAPSTSPAAASWPASRSRSGRWTRSRGTPVKLTCPAVNELRDLLDGMLPDTEQADLTRHLDDCPRCQQRLEVLAVGGEPWSGVARLERRPAAGPALSRAMAHLKQAADGVRTLTGPPVPVDFEPVLGFLDPPARPGALGRLGPYDVLALLGRGGMGVVLKALDPALDRIVAIKVLAPQLAASPVARQRFSREAKATAAVCHDHVVPIYNVDSVHGLPYLVMQCVPGPTLQERLDRDGPLELEEILRIAHQTAAGLAAAHAQGLVHRDVKPANILLENGVERVRLTDFGLARAVDDGTVTQSGYLPGTPAYMAPEQARGEAVDHRSDLFSLGSVLYA